MPVRLLVPYDRGAVIDRLHGLATDIRLESTAEGTIVGARVPRSEAERYASLRIDQASGGEKDGDARDDDGDDGDDGAGREVG